MDTKQQENKVTGGNSSPFTNLWVLSYRHGHANLTLNFEFEGTIKEAYAFAKEHAEKLGYRAAYVRPFITDLAKEVKKKSDTE